MIPTNVMSFMKKMVAAEQNAGVAADSAAGGTFGKLRQTLSSSLLTAQDKVNKMSPRPSLVPEVEATETPPPEAPPPAPKPSKTDREPGKPPSRAGACRVCLKTFKPGDVCHTCSECQHKVCEDCASYYKPDENQDPSEWRCSVCRRKVASRLPAAAQDSVDSLLEVPALDALQRRHSEARLGSSSCAVGGSGGALAPPRSPELRRHSDVSPASLKELEKLKGTAAAAVSKASSGEASEWRRSNTGISTQPPSAIQLAQAQAANRRRSVRMPPRQRSCDGDDASAGAVPAGRQGTGAAAAQDSGLVMPAPIPRRASAYDVYTGGSPAVAGAPANLARRSSFRIPPSPTAPCDTTVQEPTAAPVPSAVGLGIDEDRRMRRRGSQLPDISALQRGGALSTRLVGPRTSDSSDDSNAAAAAVATAAAAASAAAARQLSVDGEAIRIVIHDVDCGARRHVMLRRDPTDKGLRTRGFGMRVVGGKPGPDGRLYAVIVWTVPGGPADTAGLQQGDRIIEWSSISLIDRSFEEVCSVMDGSSTADVIDLLVEQQEGRLDGTPEETHSVPTTNRKQETPTVGLVIEPDMDKSPSSPTRRKLPKTPV